MKTEITSKFKKLSRKEQLSIIAGGSSLNGGKDEGTGSGGTNNGSGSGNVVGPCTRITITECLYQDKCTKEYTRIC